MLDKRHASRVGPDKEPRRDGRGKWRSMSTAEYSDTLWEVNVELMSRSNPSPTKSRCGLTLLFRHEGEEERQRDPRLGHYAYKISSAE